MSSATPARSRRSAIAARLLCPPCSLRAQPRGVGGSARRTGPTAPDGETANDYIVTLADAPIAAYDGDVAGYDATQPADGEDVDVDSADATRYRAYLRKRQDTVAARIGSAPDDRYEVGVNAFTAEITGAAGRDPGPHRRGGVGAPEHSAPGAGRQEVGRLPRVCRAPTVSGRSSAAPRTPAAVWSSG